MMAARGSFQVTKPSLPPPHPQQQSMVNQYTGCIYATPRGPKSGLPLESSADHERCHYCNLLLQQTPGSWARSALEVLEMHKGKAGKQRRSAFCLKMQQPCRPGGAQQPYSEKGEFPCLLVQISF